MSKQSKILILWLLYLKKLKTSTLKKKEVKCLRCVSVPITIHEYVAWVAQRFKRYYWTKDYYKRLLHVLLPYSRCICPHVQFIKKKGTPHLEMGYDYDYELPSIGSDPPSP